MRRGRRWHRLAQAPDHPHDRGKGQGGERPAPAKNEPEVKGGLRQTTEPELSLSRCPWEEQALRYPRDGPGALPFPGKLREGVSEAGGQHSRGLSVQQSFCRASNKLRFGLKSK